MKHKIFSLTSLIVISFLGITSISLALEDTWTKKADMPIAKCGTCSSVVNGKIYVFGGGDAITNSGGDAIAKAFSIVEEYDPSTNTWTPKSEMPTKVGFATASTVNGKIYVIGGGLSGGIPISTVEEYDPATDTWTKKANLPIARMILSSSVVNGKIYAIGGLNNGGDLTIVEEYDPKTDKWTKKSAMSIAREGTTTCEVNGKIYAIGGWNGINGALASVEEYNPATDTWTKKSDMPTAISYLSCGAVNGMVYVIGGNKNGNANGTTGLSTVEMYNPTTDTWTKKADIPTSRQEFCASAVDGYIYAIGGAKLFLGWAFPVTTVISTVEAYDTGFRENQLSAINASGKLSTTWGKIKQY
jgi:N-acetylneuraminic acid mutarotase